MAEATDSPFISVVLINYNNEKDTVACLETLADQTYDDFCTIVVDNDSDPESFAYVQERYDYPIYIRNDENRGFTGGNNPGIERALELGSSYVLLLNNDTEVAPDFLRDLVDAAESLPSSAGVIGPKIHTYGSGELWAAGGEVDNLTGETKHRADESRLDEPEEVDYVVGAALLARAEVFEDVGLLDEDFFIYYEETEFCYRARAHNWDVWYVPVSGVYHKENNEFTHSSFRDYYFTRNRWLFIQKTQSASRRLPFYAYFILRWFLSQIGYLLLIERDTDAAGATFWGTIDAMVGRTGKRSE